MLVPVLTATYRGDGALLVDPHCFAGLNRDRAHGIDEDTARKYIIHEPMVTAADVGDAVLEVSAGDKPPGVWRVTGRGLQPLQWVPEDFGGRTDAQA